MRIMFNCNLYTLLSTKKCIEYIQSPITKNMLKVKVKLKLS